MVIKIQHGQKMRRFGKRLRRQEIVFHMQLEGTSFLGILNNITGMISILRKENLIPLMKW
ncbi:hypothetical protein DZB85_19305 [Bacillus sp. LB(2018)]|nr:hypothetical protein DZB85_19305 [Bacillus sp. LB(2018)]